MTREEFDALVTRLEEQAARAPGGVKWRVGVLAALGFSYLLLVLAVSLACTAGLLFLMIVHFNVATLKLGIVVGIVTGGLSWAILRGLFVRMSAPEGLRIIPAEVPELFRLIDDLRAQLRAPHFHDVMLTPEHNAGVCQTPRLGVFGWHRNTLLLGLPLLRGVSVEEFRAILAHEFAHLSGAHGKFGAWIYRLRLTWERIFDQLARQNQGSKVLGKFIEWFWPRFNARAFVLSRRQEYEADALAAQLTSPRALAHGLIRTQVQGRWLEEKFWPDFYARVRDTAAPPATLFQEIGARLDTLHTLPETPRWLEQAYHFKTHNADTHPCLTDRLRAIPGLPADINPDAPLPAPPAPDAATALLGAHGEKLAALLAKEWSEHVAPAWQERHAVTQKMSAELAALENDAEPPTVEKLWSRAQIIFQRDDDAAAQPILEQILALDPAHARALFIRGRHLLAQDDSAGLAHLERAAEHDRSLTRDACNLLHDYFSRTGQHDRLPELDRRMDAFEGDEQNAQAERADAKPGDTYLPHELTSLQLDRLRELFAAHPDLGIVHVARKQVTHFPAMPMYVFALGVKVPWWRFRWSSSNQKLVSAIVEGIDLQGHWLAFVDESNLHKLAKAIRKIPGTEIYRRA